MRIAVLSDLHLGRGDQADRGQTHDEKLLQLLDYLETHYEMIVLLGDIWELLTSTWPRSHKQEIKRVKQAHSKIAQRFMGSQYHYIIGNHDQAMGMLQDMPTELVLNIDQMRIIFTHGHQFDIWANQLRYISEFVVWISGWASRFGVHAFTRFFDWFHNLITGTSKESKLGTLENKLIKNSIKRGAHLTVMGHTHLPGIFSSEGHLLVNSGHGLCGTFHFVSINTQKAQVMVHRVNQSVGDQLHEEDIFVLNSSIVNLNPML